MGAGDDIMATGLARGAHARGKRVAFGDGQRIIWGPFSKEIFAGNPNIAPPGSERDLDIEWVRYHKGHRVYNRQQGDRWVWNYDWSPTPGEIYFRDAEERRRVFRVGDPDIVVIEPSVPQNKSCAPNKQWPTIRWQQVANDLRKQGHRVGQFVYDGMGGMLSGVEAVPTRSFRDALLVMSNVRLLICHEGGLHHGAAAVGTSAVVIFGGWIPPNVTGYGMHKNLSGLVDGEEYCGRLHRCDHCQRALARISVEMVLDAATQELEGGR